MSQRSAPSNLKLISLKDERSSIAGFSFAPKKTKNWIVFLSEAASDFRHGTRRELEELVGARVARHFNFLVVNKPGLHPGGVNRKLFEESARRRRRIDDALTAIREIIPKGARLHIVGYSEGAYLAPQVARRDKRVQTVSMIGGGTRGWLKEELSMATPRERRFYEKKIDEIYRHPRSLEKWNGFSYATWYSYRGDNTLQALKNLRLPTLAILGARDRVIDLRSTIVDLVLVSERQPTQVHVFGDCGHYFTKHWRQVESVLGRFLTDTVLTKSR